MRNTLLRCWPFEDNRHLRSLFIDPRLRPWQHNLPQADSMGATVDALIAFLHDKRRSDTNRQALALFLEVLAERIDPGDACHQQLLELSRELERVAESPRERTGAVPAREPDRIRLLRLLTAHFSEEELRDLTFLLPDVDFDNLPGRGKSAKARELIQYLERRSRLAELPEAGREMRPDVPWDEAYRAV